MKYHILCLITTALIAFSVLAPQTCKCQDISTQSQLDKLKQEYQKGTITLEQYQQQSNALLSNTTTMLMTTTPGDHFKKGGRCLIAGSTLFLVGGALAGTSVLWDNIDYSGAAFWATLGTGCGLSLIGIICDIAGGAQLVKGGKKLNALKIGQTASLEITPLPTGAAFALKF